MEDELHTTRPNFGHSLQSARKSMHRCGSAIEKNQHKSNKKMLQNKTKRFQSAKKSMRICPSAENHRKFVEIMDNVLCSWFKGIVGRYQKRTLK